MSLGSFAKRGARKAKRVVKRLLTGRGEGPTQAGEVVPEVAHSQVLFVNGCDPSVAAPRRYRVTHQREQLELWGITTDEVYYIDATAQDANRADAFVIYRCPITPGVEALIAAAHDQDKQVFFDVDDLVCDTSYTDELPVVKAMGPDDKAVFDDGVTRNGQTLALCDGAIVTTERLAIELRRVVPHVVINRNVASREMVSLSEAARANAAGTHDSDKVIVGYFSGSMTHNADFQEALPALVSAMKKRENLYLKVVGDLELPPELAPFESRVLCAPRVDWRELPHLIASVDINLAPIEATLFNEAKSENKWLEAALVGVPTIASRFGAFAHAIRSGETGLLCANTGEWLQALLSLVDSPELRGRLGEQARLWCLANNVTSTTGALLAHLFGAASKETDIATLLPASEEAREAVVTSFTASRGFEQPTGSFDSKPWEGRTLEQRSAQAQAILSDGKRLAVFVYERQCGDDATFRYFGYNAVQHLEHSSLWGGIWLFVDELEGSMDLIAQSSAIVLIRCRIRPELYDLASFARNHGIPMGYLIDDNALGSSRAPRIVQAMATDPSSDFERAFWTGVCERFGLASELATCLMVPVASFAALLREGSTKPVLTVHSSLNDEQVAIARQIEEARIAIVGDSRFVVGYFSGTSSHQEDFALVRPALCYFLDKHRDARLLLGGHLRIDKHLASYLQTGQLVLMPHVDYVTLQYLQAAVDVVLAPLVVDDFTNCKSALKVFEAAVVGTPACASPSSAYREAIDEGKTGFVCSVEDEWLEALTRMYKDQELRDSLAGQARRQALERYYGKASRKELERALDTLASLDPADGDLEGKAALLGELQIANWDDPFDVNPRFAKR